MRTHLSWVPDRRGIRFEGFRTGPIPDFPLDPEDGGEDDAGVELLEELWGEDRVDRDASGILTPWNEIYALGPGERAILGIPEPSSSVTGRVRTDQWVNAAEFRIWLEVAVQTDKQPQPVFEAERTGLLFETQDGPVLPGRELGELIQLLDHPVPTDVDERTLLVAQAKRLASAAGVEMDLYLQNEEYVFPEGLGVEVDAIRADELHIRSTAEGVDEEAFQKFATDTGPTRTTYTQRLPAGRRRRLVLSEEQRKAIDQVRSTRVIRGPDVARFLENPEAFLPDLIDVENFSPRVRGLIPQRYQSQPYLIVRQSAQRGWFEVSPEIELIAEPPPGGPVPDLPGDQEERSAGYPTGTGPVVPPTRPSGDDEGGISPNEYRELCETVFATGEPYQLYKGAWIKIEPERAQRFLEGLNQLETAPSGQLIIPTERIGLILDVISNTEELEFEEEARSFFVEPDVPDYPLPAGLKAVLWPHQEKGYRWMRFLREQRLGGLLADDMGLGKTVQVIAFLAHLQEAGCLDPALIVVPKSLMRNWQREIWRFAPSIHRILLHRGTLRSRNPRDISLNEVVITTYATLRRDQILLGQVDWSVVVCDEAQNVKNPTANVTAAVKGMKAGTRLAATGTPVENGLSELWCIMDYAQPGRLGSRREFREQYERPIVEADVGTEVRLGASLRLQEQLVPHYVRRTKEEALPDLPEKKSKIYWVPMSERQRSVYARILGRIREGSTIPIAGLQKLIQVCSHPELQEPRDANIEKLLEDAPKMSKTLDVLDGISSSGEKAVVFTRFREMQRILAGAIAARFGFYPKILNGQVDGDNRQAIVDLFNASPGFRVMILSPDAAGVGLNITGANHAIHYTRLWNPAKENQATDRIHRMGQDRPVTVHYPVVVGDGFKSVEEHLDDLLREKLDLARDVLIPRDLLDVTAELRGLVAAEPVVG